MQISGVDFITVPTRDFDKASEFYGGVLGLPCSARWGRMPAAEFETGSLTIAVMQSDAFGIEFHPHTHPIALHVRMSLPPARSSRRTASPSPPTPSTAASATWPISRTRTATR